MKKHDNFPYKNLFIKKNTSTEKKQDFKNSLARQNLTKTLFNPA